MEIIGVIVAGVIIGLLGKWVAPGDKDNIPIWLTIVCGIAGVIIGWYIYSAFGGNGSPGRATDLNPPKAQTAGAPASQAMGLGGNRQDLPEFPPVDRSAYECVQSL